MSENNDSILSDSPEQGVQTAEEAALIHHSASSGADPLASIRFLREKLGGAFVDWVLVEPSDSPSPRQAEVANLLAEVLRTRLEDQPNLPIWLAASSLAFFVPAWGTTSVEYLRNYVGEGRLEPRSAVCSEDPLLDSIIELASASYGELLLSGSARTMSVVGHLTSPIGRRVVEEVRREGIFSNSSDEVGAESVMTMSSSGISRSFQAALYGSSVVTTAWEIAKLEKGLPTLDDLLAKIPDALRQARHLLQGDRVQIIGAAALTGVQLPEGVEVSGSWGRIRRARREDHPEHLADAADRKTVTTTDTGQRVEICDAGDLVLEVELSMSMEIVESIDSSTITSTTHSNLEDIIGGVRLSLALALDRNAIPVLLPTWRRFIAFLQMEAYSHSDPSHFAVRHPILLTHDEANEWGKWIGIVLSTNMEKLKLTKDRILRAAMERRDPHDTLIDSVIAWESIFGGSQESTLRVSMSLARLLYPASRERDDAQRKFKNIYRLRSDIVHGNPFRETPQQVYEAGRTATKVALDALAVLLTKRRDLLQITKSSDRSVRVLLGDPIDEISFGTES